MKEFAKILKSKREYYGNTEAAIEFAAEEYAKQFSGQIEPPVIGNFAGVEDCYNNFWKDILEENGELDWEQVKKELFDYANILREVSIVYDTLTMGRISKPNTKAQVVIDEVNEVNREIEEDDSKISL